MVEFNLASQFIPIAQQGIKKFVSNALGPVGQVLDVDNSGRIDPRGLSKHSTQNLEFPLDVSSGDPGLGNHGHYIMFYINTQERAKLRTSEATDKGSVVDDVSQGYNIPKYIKEWDTVTGSYVSKNNESARVKQLNADMSETARNDPFAEERFKKAADNASSRYQSKGSTVRIKRAATKRLKTAIAMYMPASVQVTYGANYTDTEIGYLTEAALNAFNSAKSGDVKGAINEITGVAPEIANGLERFMLGTIGAIPGFAGTKEAFEAKEGAIISDRLELAFKGINKRVFQYTFKMIPKNEREAEMIRKIVFAFKANMLPEFVGGNRAGRRLVVPNTFDIQYMYAGKTNEFLHHISTCVLENMNVSYGGDRYKTFDATADGAPPVETSVTLNFKEMELITRERVFEGF